jgi:integrase/recombinase XerD
MKVLADLSDWLLSHGMVAADLRRSDVDCFLRHRRAAGHNRYVSIRAVRPVLDYLQRVEVVPRQAFDAALGPVDVMLDRFWRYLTVERALAVVTARAYLDMVRPFIQGRLSADFRALNLECLTAADIISFVVTRCPRQSRGAAKLTVTALRSFLRFLHLDGVIEGSLLSAVPSVAGRRLVGLPKGLAPEEVRRLFASCDETTRRGCRDIAILTMLVRLGMRSGEVAKLRLDDIDWRAGEIIVQGKANSIERIPLPADVGRAVARYGPLSPAWPSGQRPRADCICQNQSPSSPSQFLRREQRGGRCRQAAGRIHAHRLRHTAAIQMLRAGASLPEIGQLLRHRRALTTAIYAKVDRDTLRTIARPWLGDAA